jgi:hypothetical protein
MHDGCPSIAENERCRHQQLAARHRVDAGWILAGLLDHGQDAAGVRQLALPRYTEAHKAGSPVAQSDAHPPFQRRHRARDGGRRQR